MTTQDIPMRDWPSFFGHFSRIHQGAIVTVSVSSPDAGAFDAMLDQPFAGISSDGDDVIVHVGTRIDRPHLQHHVLHVDTVHLQQTAEGADAELDIDAFDGIRAMVKFRSPMYSDLLDAAVE